MMNQTKNLIDENGRRTDGRNPDELRQIKITVGVVKNADGSAFIEFGRNKIIAVCLWPLGKYIQNTWHFRIDVF